MEMGNQLSIGSRFLKLSNTLFQRLVLGTGIGVDMKSRWILEIGPERFRSPQLEANLETRVRNEELYTLFSI